MPSIIRLYANKLKRPQLLAIVNKYRDYHNLTGIYKLTKGELIDIIEEYEIPLP